MSSDANSMTDDERNIALYSALLKQHGDSFKALDWGSRASQQLRFRVLSEVGVASGDTLLDVGCGLGDLYQWLEDNRPGVVYNGIDITRGMISRAADRFPEIRFAERNIKDMRSGVAERYDYVVASGIFAHRQHRAKEFMNTTIQDMFEVAIKGVAFNCLSCWRDDREEGEFYADPIETAAFCRTVSKRIVLRHDYHPGDFTVFIYKPDLEN